MGSSMMALHKKKQKKNQRFISSLTRETSACQNVIRTRRIMQKRWLLRKLELQNSRRRMMQTSN